MNNEEREVRPHIVSVNRDDPVFLLVLKQVNAAVVPKVWIIHAQNFVFLMLWKS